MKAKNCRINTGQLLAYLTAPTQHQEVEVHLETCPACRQKLARLSQAVLSEKADHLTCGQCEANLPDYVQAEAEGEDPATLFPEVREHLALCPHCQRSYQQLLEIHALVMTGDLAEPVVYSLPDISFLKRLEVPDALGKIARRGAYWVQSQAQALFVDMGAFFQVHERQPALAVAVRGESRELKETLYQIALGPESLENLDVEITIYREPDRAEVARVVVQVCTLDRLVAGFEGSQVQMRVGGVTRTAKTDEDGKAVFEGVPLADVKEATFEIVPA
jgi:hypothetical protein